MEYKPLSSNVILKRIEESRKIEGGDLELPPNANPNNITPRGEVIATGPGRKTNTGTVIPLPVNKGDTVVFNLMAARAIDIEGVEEDCVITPAEEIIAVIGE